MKSGYHVLLTANRQLYGYNSEPCGLYKIFYRALGDLQVPAKLRIHMWRLFNNYVPHFSNLVKRRVQVANVCPLCKEVSEDIDHLLWSCGVLRQLWHSLNLSVDVNLGTLDGKNQLVNTFITADNATRKLLVISFWAFWSTRNKVVYEGLKFSQQDLVGFVQGYAFELSLPKVPVASPLSNASTLWQPPTSGFTKLNFDASFQEDSNTSTVAVLARNDMGLILGACTYPYTDVADAFVAEARACERALLFAIDMGFRLVILEGDSLTIIKKLTTVCPENC